MKWILLIAIILIAVGFYLAVHIRIKKDERRRAWPYTHILYIEDWRSYFEETELALVVDRGWDGAGWYYLDEAQQFCTGPYNTEKEAIYQLERYAESLG